MFKKTIATFALVATLASAATIAMPTAEAEARGGRNAAFAIGAFHRSCRRRDRSQRPSPPLLPFAPPCPGLLRTSGTLEPRLVQILFLPLPLLQPAHRLFPWL